MMKITRVYVFLCLLLIFCLKAKAQQGCVISGKIFYQKTGEVGAPLTRYLYDSSLSYDVIATCPANDYNTYALQGTAVTTGFPFYTLIECGFTGDSWFVANRGRVYNFTILNCPIDDYIPFLILVTGGLGFFYLRRKNKPISVIQ